MTILFQYFFLVPEYTELERFVSTDVCEPEVPEISSERAVKDQSEVMVDVRIHSCCRGEN